MRARGVVRVGVGSHQGIAAMTVMPSDVADKAVSTEDASSAGEVVRLEAVLAALVETKVEAMKASSASNPSKKSGSAPSSPRRPRLTSSSTASSSQNHHYHHDEHRHYDHHHHQPHQLADDRHRRENPHGAKKHDSHRHRRHDSAPCADYIEDPTSRDHRKQRSGERARRRRASEMPRSPRKKRRHSKSPKVLRDVNLALDSRFELLDIDADQDLALINFERSREALGEACDYPGIHQSACYFSHSAAHHNIHYDQDDCVVLNVDDGFEDEISLEGDKKRDDKRERYHRPRRKRKRKRRIVEADAPEEEYVDPEELPPRARWTIVATACLLLAMSLLLVGVTLRMAPIIDDMGDGRRASVCRKGPANRRASTAVSSVGSSSRRKDSVRPTTRIEISEAKGKIVVKSPLELEQARRHRRIAMIVVGTFFFLLMASILVVVVTLTHSSFHIPPVGSKELAEHRANRNFHQNSNDTLRKENEELMNSLKRDNSVPENSTAPL